MDALTVIGKYLIPILYVYFGWRYIRKPAAFGEREGFAAGRARESEEIWNYSQRAAGIYCIAAAVVLAVMIYLIGEYFPEAPRSVFWIQVGVQIASVALLVPAVCLFVNLKFPKK